MLKFAATSITGSKDYLESARSESSVPMLLQKNPKQQDLRDEHQQTFAQKRNSCSCSCVFVDRSVVVRRAIQESHELIPIRTSELSFATVSGVGFCFLCKVIR